MSNKPDGGPAFPEVVTEYHGSHGEYTQDVHSVGGMTLRDYFAAKALSAVASGFHRVGKDFIGEEDYEAAAYGAYEMADAMLKARNQ